MLKEQEKNVGGQAEQKSYQLHDVTSRNPTLDDQGISEIQSHRWQKIVDIPEEVFEEFIDETKAKEVKKILPLGDFFSRAGVQVAHHFIH